MREGNFVFIFEVDVTLFYLSLVRNESVFKNYRSHNSWMVGFCACVSKAHEGLGCHNPNAIPP